MRNAWKKSAVRLQRAHQGAATPLSPVPPASCGQASAGAEARCTPWPCLAFCLRNISCSTGCNEHQQPGLKTTCGLTVSRNSIARRPTVGRGTSRSGGPAARVCPASPARGRWPGGLTWGPRPRDGEGRATRCFLAPRIRTRIERPLGLKAG